MEIIEFTEAFPKYLEFINTCRMKPPAAEDLVDKHHIHPRMCNGSNDKSNLIHLRIVDHTRAHYYMAKESTENGVSEEISWLMINTILSMKHGWVSNRKVEMPTWTDSEIIAIAAMRETWLKQHPWKGGAAVQASWDDPESRARRCAAAKLKWENPVYKAGRLEWQKEYWSDPERQQAQRDMNAEYWADPEVLAHHAQKMKVLANTPEDKRRRSKSALNQWKDPEVRARMIKNKSIAQTGKPIKGHIVEVAGVAYKSLSSACKELGKSETDRKRINYLLIKKNAPAVICGGHEFKLISQRNA